VWSCGALFGGVGYCWALLLLLIALLLLLVGRCGVLLGFIVIAYCFIVIACSEVWGIAGLARLGFRV